MDKRERGGGEHQDFPSKMFCLTVPKISVGESFTVALISDFGYRESLDKREGGHQDFPSKMFCLTVPKNFVGEPFNVSLTSGTEKVWIREGGYQVFPSKNFVSLC